MPPAAPRPLAASLQEYGRGVAGGLLFSLPLLYTMEVWGVGHTAPPERLLAFVAATFALLVAYNHVGGLRAERGLGEDLFESVEELGLGLITAAVVLWLIGRLPPECSLAEAVGKVVVEGMVAAVGVSIGTQQLGEGPTGGEDEEGDDDEPALGRGPERYLAGEIVVAALGAVVVAANVAPTEEIVLIAAEASRWQLVGLALLALALAALILNAGGFRGSERIETRPAALGPFQGTAVTYAVALIAAAGLLWLFEQFEGFGFAAAAAQTVVLGVPATLGAAAGRLLLRGNR